MTEYGPTPTGPFQNGWLVYRRRPGPQGNRKLLGFIPDTIRSDDKEAAAYLRTLLKKNGTAMEWEFEPVFGRSWMLFTEGK